jgi:hypothetical protein
VKFEWDSTKAASNLRRHVVSFDEATTVFADPLAATRLDPRYEVEERRFVTLGHSSAHRLIVVAHVDRGDRIRIITARSATGRERRTYEAGEEGRR